MNIINIFFLSKTLGSKQPIKYYSLSVPIPEAINYKKNLAVPSIIKVISKTYVQFHNQIFACKQQQCLVHKGINWHIKIL